MDTIQHSLVPEAHRHEPKGATLAPRGHVLVANGDATTRFDAIKGLPAVASVLTASKTNKEDYVSASVLTPDAGVTADTMELRTNGELVLTGPGFYHIAIDANVTRSATTGSTDVYFQFKDNAGKPLSDISHTPLHNKEAGEIRQIALSEFIDVPAGTVKSIFPTVLFEGLQSGTAGVAPKAITDPNWEDLAAIYWRVTKISVEQDI